MIDYYAILNVRKDSNLEIIKKKYQRRLKKYNPNNTTDPSAAKKLQLVKEAYSVLSNDYQRGRYDMLYEQEKSRMDKPSFENIFNELSVVPKISTPFNLSNLMRSLPNSKSNYNMRSFSSSTFTGKDGKLHTKRNIITNNNGKKNNYYQEFTTDKNGKINLIREKGIKPKKYKTIMDKEW